MRKLLSDFNFKQKYARYRKEDKRRENFEEAVDRVLDMHKKHLGSDRTFDLENELKEIERAYKDKRILGSQRSLQFGGRGVLEKHARGYNCTACYVDNPHRFAQSLYLLLCGAGVGFSVQDHHIEQLPSIMSEEHMMNLPQVHYVVRDTIEGWADALDELVKAYFGLSVYMPCFDFSSIRPNGAVIESCGGKTSGAYPLRLMLQKAESLLNARCGQRLRSVDVCDLMCIGADCVLAGGVRRSALICLFSPHDADMIEYKSKGEWWNTHPYRARVNISAVLNRNDPNAQTFFDEIFESTQKYGEPAVIWTDSSEFVFNPCVEIGMCPTLVTDPNGVHCDISLDMLKNRMKYEDKGYMYETGFQFCNLTEVNAGAFKDFDDALEAVKLATILGLIQATYTGTSDDYLADTCTKAILERESLLGVSLTGICTAPEWLRSGGTLALLAEEAKNTAMIYYARVGLANPPARVTCVKPSGNASVLLGCSSGIHPEHAERYLRRVQVPPHSPIVQRYIEHNPHGYEASVWGGMGDYVLPFALECKKDTLTRSHLSATAFLDLVATVQRLWVNKGTLRPRSVEGLRHNVSNTCTVDAQEWPDVKQTLLEGREIYCGVSCLSASGDYDYPQAPFQRVFHPSEIDISDPNHGAKMEAWRLWCTLRENAKEVEYDDVIEETDTTEILNTVACGGGSCDIV